MTVELRKLAARIVADAADVRIDDASFRRRALRIANKLQRESQRLGQARPARYVFVAVPRGDGGTASISIAVDTFDELARALGGRREVAAAARKLALGFRPETGLSRSNYVRRRLQQKAAKVFEASPPQLGRAASRDVRRQ